MTGFALLSTGDETSWKTEWCKQIRNAYAGARAASLVALNYALLQWRLWLGQQFADTDLGRGSGCGGANEKSDRCRHLK